ncbi:MAG: J domain-containing protein [Acetatifactor sp.]|nr:J domain-containing protein [Acetatifactor sp.]
MKWFSNIQTIDELRNQYKKLLIKYHPDNNPDTDTTAVMQEINSEYDSFLKQFTANQTSSRKCDYSTETELKRVLNEVIKMKADIEVELVGFWIWISGDTYPVKHKLKELNFKWASKKKMWYWGVSEHRCTIPMEMSSIREKYGSILFKTRQEVDAIDAR